MLFCFYRRRDDPDRFYTSIRPTLVMRALLGLFKTWRIVLQNDAVTSDIRPAVYNGVLSCLLALCYLHQHLTTLVFTIYHFELEILLSPMNK